MMYGGWWHLYFRCELCLDFNRKIGFVSYFVSFIVPQYVRFFFVRISWSLLIFFCVDLSSWRLLLHWFLFCTCCVSWPRPFSNRPVLLLAPGLDFLPRRCKFSSPAFSLRLLRTWSATDLSFPLELHRSRFSLPSVSLHSI
jgi:hypothetical protein